MLKFDLKRDDHDSFGPSREIATQIFLKSTMSQIQFLFMEWGNFVTEKNEGIPFSTEIQVVGSYTDRLLTF